MKLAFQKGKRKFVTVVSDLEQSSLLEVIDSHKSEEIIEVLKGQSIEIRENVKEVNVDMWGGFQKAVRPRDFSSRYSSRRELPANFCSN